MTRQVLIFTGAQSAAHVINITGDDVGVVPSACVGSQATLSRASALLEDIVFYYISQVSNLCDDGRAVGGTVGVLQ